MTQILPLLERGVATKPLLELLELTGVKDHYNNILQVWVATQKHWREPKKHSGDIKDRFSHLKDKALPYFEQLGFIGEQVAMPQSYYNERLKMGPYYDYALVCGAYILAVRKRFALLHRLWKEGLRFGHLVLCGGKRPANPEKESLAIVNKADSGLSLLNGWQPLTEVPATEDLIMESVLQQSDLPISWVGKGCYTVVDTPLRTDRPSKPDPSAEDTFRHWLRTQQPKADSRILLVYSQPQLRHIEVVARHILAPMNMFVDCVGYDASEINVSQTCDTIAKVIHELKVQSD